MALEINQDLLSRISLAIVIGIVIVGALIGLKVAGFLGGDEAPSVSGGKDSLPGATESSATIRSTSSSSKQAADDTGNKEITIDWDYKDRSFSYSALITNKTYNAFKSRRTIPAGTNTGDIITQYVVTEGDGGIVGGLAGYILRQSVENGWGDYDTIMNTIACIEQFGPGNFENTKDDGNYRYPLVTLWDGGGDREDMSILAASMFEAMGYPVAFMVFPEQYDRGHMIWEYPAIGIRCEDETGGRTYVLSRNTTVGTVNCYPQTGAFNVPASPGFEPESGCFTGNATIKYEDGRTVPAGEVSWDIPSGTISARDGLASTPGAVPVVCRIVNASWVTGESYVYIDTMDSSVLPGTIPGEFARVEPGIFTSLIGPENGIKITRDDRIDSSMPPLLRIPSPLEDTSGVKFRAGIAEVLGLPVPLGVVDEAGEANVALEDEYWENVWYDATVNAYDQVWFLDVLDYEVTEPMLLYTKSNEIYVSPPAAWRIRCEALPVDPPDRDLEGISSFSDIRVAVFKVDENNGSAGLAGEMSFGYKTGQENVKYLNMFETGNFYIATFVRNCEAEVSIQVHGKGQGLV